MDQLSLTLSNGHRWHEWHGSLASKASEPMRVKLMEEDELALEWVGSLESSRQNLFLPLLTTMYLYHVKGRAPLNPHLLK